MEHQEKPKILIFSIAYHPLIGGAEVAIQKITKRLGGEFEFDLITAKLNKDLASCETIDKVNVFRLGNGNKFSKYLFPWRASKKAKELHQKNNYKIVWAVLAGWAGWAALKFKEKNPDVKYLLTMQSGDSDEHIKKKWGWMWKYKKIYQQADRIQVISKWLEKRARKFGYQGEIDLVPNGVSTKHKTQLAEHKEEKIVLTVSRLVKKNGIEDLIRSMPILLNYQSIKLLIIGDGPLKNKLENLVKDLQLEDKITFAGSVDFDDLPSYYAMADVFCRPSISEGFGNVFVEAMAQNVPVVATPVGGIPDFLKDGETGWLCQVRNPASIAEKIKYILHEKSKNEVQKVISNAKKMVEEKYTWEIIAEKMRKVFQKLL